MTELTTSKKAQLKMVRSYVIDKALTGSLMTEADLRHVIGMTMGLYEQRADFLVEGCRDYLFQGVIQEA